MPVFFYTDSWKNRDHWKFSVTYEHALDWLEYRHSSVEANKLLRMLPAERAKALNGRTIEEVLSGEPYCACSSGGEPPEPLRADS